MLGVLYVDDVTDDVCKEAPPEAAANQLIDGVSPHKLVLATRAVEPVPQTVPPVVVKIGTVVPETTKSSTVHSSEAELVANVIRTITRLEIGKLVIVMVL